MEATRSSFIAKAAIGLSALLLAAVMLVCIPQGQALADDAAADAAAVTALQEFTATKAVGEQPTASAADVANAPKRASGVKSKCGLLCKVGKKYYLYPCNKKGKKLGTYWRVGSSITTVFVSSNVKKYKGTWKIRYKSTIKLSYPVSYKISKIVFLTKKGKNSVNAIGKNAIDSTVKTVKNFNKTRVKTIGEKAFAYTKITKIAFPKTLKTIGAYGFYNCTNLRTLSGLGKTHLQSLGTCAFARTKISAIAFPNTLTRISDYAFNSCTSLTSVTLPANCTTIGAAAFNSCSSLGVVKVLSPTVVSTAYDAFGYTKMDGSSPTGRIYVPAALVKSYINDSNWRYYAACIAPLA